MVHVSASSIDDDGHVRSLGRDAITTGHVEVPVNFYRTSDPPIFAGFQVNWLEGTDTETETTYDLSAGAGFGSRYATLRVHVPGHDPIYEYLDAIELMSHRIRAIIAEVTGAAPPEEGEQPDRS
jgi:hypothetical protein